MIFDRNGHQIEALEKARRAPGSFSSEALSRPLASLPWQTKCRARVAKVGPAGAAASSAGGAWVGPALRGQLLRLHFSCGGMLLIYRDRPVARAMAYEVLAHLRGKQSTAMGYQRGSVGMECLAFTLCAQPSTTLWPFYGYATRARACGRPPPAQSRQRLRRASGAQPSRRPPCPDARNDESTNLSIGIILVSGDWA